MANDAVRLEALGEQHVTLTFRGIEITVPRALEDWPLDLIRAGRHIDALYVLVGSAVALPYGEDAAQLSNDLADAVGCSLLPETPRGPMQMFGAVPELLRLLDKYEDDVASDLRRFWQVDYRDRWRGGLTLRGIWSLIRRMPADSALGRAVNEGDEVWTRAQLIAAQSLERMTGRYYPGRPLTEDELTEALAALAEKQRADAAYDDRAAHYAQQGATQSSSAGDPVAVALSEARENALRDQRSRKG